MRDKQANKKLSSVNQAIRYVCLLDAYSKGRLKVFKNQNLHPWLDNIYLCDFIEEL